MGACILHFSSNKSEEEKRSGASMKNTFETIYIDKNGYQTVYFVIGKCLFLIKEASSQKRISFFRDFVIQLIIP